MLQNSLASQLKRLKGALSSGNPAARLGIFVKAVSPFGHLLDKIICGMLPQNGLRDNKIPTCLMIVSPPRSGSTIIYQVLTRVIPCVYISNLHEISPNFASYYLQKKKLFGENLSGFNNYYGYTSSINDVNEGNELVDSIFKDNADKNLVRKRFIKFVKMMRATRKQPLIFKNVRNYNNILRLHEVVPEIIFLRVKRNTEQVIQSVLRAYYELGKFHPVPRSLINSRINDPLEFSVRQILEMEKEIDNQKKQIKQSAWVEWTYEGFCSNTLPMIENLARDYLNMDLSCLRKKAISEPLRASNRLKVSEDEANRISLLLQKYNKGL